MIVQLGELAGQLGGFVGESESVKKAVVKAIIACFDNNPHLKNDLKDVYSSYVTTLSESVNSADQADGTDEIVKLSERVTQQIKLLEQQLNSPKNLYNSLPPSPSPSADSAKLQSKLEALEKVKELCGFYENLNNHPNEPKNLLDNLCSGLETFLGFNSASKGYDGQGIVYSNLDRLCDGVMGFLSGFLSNIHKHLGQHKGEITEAIKSLEQNKHAGKNGFNAAIAEVVKGVRGYNKAVEQSNKKVSEPMTLILSQVDEEFKRSVADIFPEKTLSAAKNADVFNAVDQINEKLRHCHLSAEKFNGTFNFDKHNKTILNAVNDLNPNLVIRVKNSLSNVKHESERLK
ncbi:hypothetical protein, conserved, partial [Babesia bigemina]